MGDIDQSSAPSGHLSQFVGEWSLDKDATTIVLNTKALWGLVKVKGTFRASGGSAKVSGDGSVAGELLVDASSVDTKTPKRDAHLRTGDFFEVERHPAFRYVVTDVKRIDDSNYKLIGTLTIRTSTRPLELDAKVAFDGGTNRLTVSVVTMLDRTAWGIGWTKMGAGIHNKLLVTAVFNRA